MSSDLKIGVLLNFLGCFFFFSFLRSTLDEITKRYVKNYGGGGFEKKRKKRRKRKNLKKKRPGRDSNPRSSVSDNRGFESPLIRDRRLTTWPPSHNAYWEVELE